MPIRTAKAVWKGDLPSGGGQVSSESGVLASQPYTFPSRFERGDGTNPEELMAAAHAGCYAMALSHGLAQAGHVPTSVTAEARVSLDKVEGGFSITGITLVCRARVPGIDPATFQEQAEAAKGGCPVSKALASVPITLDAALEG